MKFTVQFQYRPSKDERPLDYGQSFGLSTEEGLTFLPNIGDHVDFPKADNISGVVENRLFTFIDEHNCYINIVVTDSDVPGGKLLKE